MVGDRKTTLDARRTKKKWFGVDEAWRALLYPMFSVRLHMGKPFFFLQEYIGYRCVFLGHFLEFASNQVSEFRIMCPERRFYIFSSSVFLYPCVLFATNTTISYKTSVYYL